MKLNIYVISHPIIKIFKQNIYKNNTNVYITSIKEKNESKIMLFLIYEILRKLISITNIYVHKLNHTQHNSIIDYQQKNYILTNMVENFNLLADIHNTFPQIHITHYDLYKNETFEIKNKDKINQKTNIIIIEKFLVEDNIINILTDITNDIKVTEKQVTIACITCTNQILEKISKYYNNITLYTTSIIYN